MSDYIEGDFVEFWSGKSYNCHALGINIPKYATLRVVEPTEQNPIGRIYIKKSYINSQRKMCDEQKNDIWRDRDDFYELKKFVDALNTPYIEPEILRSSIKLELI